MSSLTVFARSFIIPVETLGILSKSPLDDRKSANFYPCVLSRSSVDLISILSGIISEVAFHSVLGYYHSRCLSGLSFTSYSIPSKVHPMVAKK